MFSKTNFLKFNPIYFKSVKFLNYKPIETDNKIVNGHKLTQVIEKNRQKLVISKLSEHMNAKIKGTLKLQNC